MCFISFTESKWLDMSVASTMLITSSLSSLHVCVCACVYMYVNVYGCVCVWVLCVSVLVRVYVCASVCAKKALSC